MHVYLQWVLATGIILVSMIVGWIVRGVLFHRFIKWTQKTRWKGDDIIVSSLKTPFWLWCVIGGVYIALHIVTIPENILAITDRVLLTLVVFSVTLTLANMLSRLVPGKLPSLTQNIVKFTVLLLGGLILLNTLGISITPLLTTLGIGGLAVALGMQDTLTNLFAGFYTTLAKQIRVGDYVKLETGEEGYVTDISWRTTKIRMLQNNVVLVPNSKLAQTIVTNYYLPSKDLAVLVQVGVDYRSNLEHVERVTCEVARDVMKTVKGGVPEFEPFIRHHTFGDFSINFTVILRAQEFVDNFLVKHEFIKGLHKRYNEEGIVIPFPIRTIIAEK